MCSKLFKGEEVLRVKSKMEKDRNSIKVDRTSSPSDIPGLEKRNLKERAKSKREEQFRETFIFHKPRVFSFLLGKKLASHGRRFNKIREDQNKKVKVEIPCQMD